MKIDFQEHVASLRTYGNYATLTDVLQRLNIVASLHHREEAGEITEEWKSAIFVGGLVCYIILSGLFCLCMVFLPKFAHNVKLHWRELTAA